VILCGDLNVNSSSEKLEVLENKIEKILDFDSDEY
jgi:hypothetical protein